MFIELTLCNSPVLIPSLNGAGAQNEHSLWENIIGVETFPPEESGSFTIKLKKKVSCHTEVDGVEKELIEAIIILCKVWQFSGGGRLKYERTETKKIAICDSNAKFVKDELLAKEGKKIVTSSFDTAWKIFHEYKEMPMGNAIKLAHEYRRNKTVRLILDYYYDSCDDEKKWFVDLYKIKEILSQEFGSEKLARENLNIQYRDWKYFKSFLNNNDLRHAAKLKDKGKEVFLKNKVDQQTVSKLRTIALNWIRAYLEKLQA